MTNPRRRPPSSLRIAGLLALLTAGCDSGAGNSAALEESLTRIEQKQDALATAHEEMANAQKEAREALEKKLDALEKKLEAKPAARPDRPKGPRPGRPDPKATYKVAVFDGDAQKGPDTAKVTVIEWSDFQ